MFGKSSAFIFERGIEAVISSAKNEKGKIGEILKMIAGHPFKVLASFLAAPILVVKIAILVKNPIRRAIAIIGLLLSIVFAYLAATLLGTIVGAAFVASHIGILAGIGFLVGTTLSVYLSVIFSIIIFNAVSFLFLKINTQEVVDYLNEISA